MVFKYSLIIKKDQKVFIDKVTHLLERQEKCYNSKLDHRKGKNYLIGKEKKTYEAYLESEQALLASKRDMGSANLFRLSL